MILSSIFSADTSSYNSDIEFSFDGCLRLRHAENVYNCMDFEKMCVF